MTNVNEYFGGEKSPKSPVKEANKYADSDRAIYLRNWCNASKGRTSALAAHVFDHCPKQSNSLSHYKYGRFLIKDWMWDKIKVGIKLVEKKEAKTKSTPAPLNTKSTFAHSITKAGTQHSPDNVATVKETTKLFQEPLPLEEVVPESVAVDERNEFVKKWLATDRKRKLRLGNVTYVHNFTRADSMNKDYTSQYFANQVQMLEVNSSYVIHLEFDTIKKIVDKVNYFIDTNHPFAIAAGRTAE